MDRLLALPTVGLVVVVRPNDIHIHDGGEGVWVCYCVDARFYLCDYCCVDSRAAYGHLNTGRIVAC